MDNRSYWSAVFSIVTWAEFLNHGADTAGFQDGMWSVVQRIKSGDYLLCYVMKISRWAGLLEVIAEPFQDDTRIWKGKVYRSRVTVKPLVILPVKSAVPVYEVRNELLTFKQLNRPNSWGYLFKNSPSLWPVEDGTAIANAITQAKLHTQSRSINMSRFSKLDKQDLANLHEVENILLP